MKQEIEKLINSYKRQWENLKLHKEANGQYLTAEEGTMLNWRINDKFESIQDLKRLLALTD